MTLPLLLYAPHHCPGTVTNATGEERLQGSKEAAEVGVVNRDGLEGGTSLECVSNMRLLECPGRWIDQQIDVGAEKRLGDR